ncbi:single-strand selective monofunctional uracil DNA glycosylase isoform X2 [Anthonomus grandis grandis]|uniref:single-strand selective monofunctional uracil DNA glycosylase isoform X2 n=1 Tax=Anthonomus grandis grandis TaxID=2921223 RepID=UPI002165F281|nr:single-strand selective monofunctional uracil DNA glycosylase isoform X2 [Anthonomus grandis grandis]
MLRSKLYPSNNQTQEQLLDLSLQNCPPGDVSKYFPNVHPSSQISTEVLRIQDNLNCGLNTINFYKNPIEYVYNPTEYARLPYEMYVKKYCQSKKRILYVGMNPGPYGMCQTGVPFGDINWVTNWLQVEAPVSKPQRECPNRPVQGFMSTRKEQSGDKFWKLWSDVCITPERFFKESFVYNYCPLAFMGVKGVNLTPEDIKDRQELERICDMFYLDIINLLQPQIIVAVGRYIEKRTKLVLKGANSNIQILYLPHPSPRPKGNQNWSDKAIEFLRTNNNLLQYFT